MSELWLVAAVRVYDLLVTYILYSVDLNTAH